MKKIIILASVIFLAIAVLIPATKVSGQTPTKSAEATEEDDIDTIERIKDLVASKVAELDLVERRGIFGTVKSTGNTQLTMMDHSGAQRAVDIDELTEFENGDEDDFGISDIGSDDILSVVGLYNKDNQRMLARFISITKSIPMNIDGKITAIDEDDFTVTVKTTTGDTWTVEIETSTDTFVYADSETEDSGFSRLEIGQRVIVVGFQSKDGEGLMSASRVIHFSGIPPSRMIDEFEDSGEEEKVSTGSAGQIEIIE